MELKYIKKESIVINIVTNSRSRQSVIILNNEAKPKKNR